MNEHEIIVCGPAGDDFLLDVDGQEFLLSSNADIYLTSELKRVAPAFAGLPVFYRHTPGAERSRVVMGSAGRVGRLQRAWWNGDERQIRAILKVTSAHWQGVFSDLAGRRTWGFSMDCDAQGKELRTLGMTAFVRIPRLYSVDVVGDPAMGGRFVDAPALTEDELWAEWTHFETTRQMKLERRI